MAVRRGGLRNRRGAARLKPRPAASRASTETFTDRIEGALASRPEQRTVRLQRKSCSVLATHQLDTEARSDEALLEADKGQQKVERGFRFLRDPLFLASSLYLKSPKRLRALMRVMTLCLLVYAALEYRLRQALKVSNQTLPNQKGKPIQNPTMRWVFQLFAGIHLLLIQGVQALVLNLNDLHRQVLWLLGPPNEKLYA